ncbi:MAG: prepilin-type N-terminal cleavage/methylation domain-containing protein [Candidatus Paceibacterota bacterium]|jgi:prepilin-type N-terminal cleavage/methylation domain-containing protein
MNSRRGFTLIELLIVIGIVAVLVTVVVLVINPANIRKEARDVVRQTDLKTLSAAIQFATIDKININTGEKNKIYLSLPDNNPNCSSYSNLPVLSPGWSYACVSRDNLRKIDGTGWVPVDFRSLAFSLLSVLPIDPANDAVQGLYYSYAVGSWEFETRLESTKYAGVATEDGGKTPLLLEIGSDLNLMPSQISDRLSPPATGVHD